MSPDRRAKEMWCRKTNVDETNATPTAIRATSNGRAVVWKQSLAWEMKILPVPLFSDYTGSKLSEAVELDTFDRDTGLDLVGKSSGIHPLLGKVVHECRTRDLSSGRSSVREVVPVGRDYWSQQDSPRHCGTLGPRGGCCSLRRQCHVRRFTGLH